MILRMLDHAPPTFSTFDQTFLCISASCAPKELHHKNIPEKLYKIFDRIRQTVSGYRPSKPRKVFLCKLVKGYSAVKPPEIT